MYGSLAVAEKADALFKGLTSWADGGTSERKARQDILDQARAAFTAAARADLRIME